MSFLETKLFKYVFVALGIAGVLALLSVAFGGHRFKGGMMGSYGSGQQIPQISVTGSGESFAVADLATFSFQIINEAKTTVESLDVVKKKLADITKALKAQGIEDKDIKAENYYTNPKYAPESANAKNCIYGGCSGDVSRNIVGYETGVSVTVKVRKSDNTGTVIGEVTKLGATSVGGVNFVVDDEDAVRAEARKEAIANAEKKAKVLADDLGVRLVRVLNFNEDGYYPMYNSYAKADMVMMAGAESAPSAPIDLPKGENQFNINVTITYEIR